MNANVHGLFACLLIALATASCGTTLVREEIAPRSADRVATRVALLNVNHGPCDVPPIHLDRSGHGDPLARPEGSEVLAGFNNFLIRGADPFPCNRQSSQDYTGAVHFNLDDVRGTVVDRATLRLERRNTSIPWNAPGRSSTSACLVAAARATEDWEAGYTSGPEGTTISAVAFRRRSSGRIEGSYDFDNGVTSIHLDVTSIVQGWASGRPNFGFVIRQQEPNGANVGANDRSCTSVFFNASLEMSIRRFVPASP